MFLYGKVCIPEQADIRHTLRIPAVDTVLCPGSAALLHSISGPNLRMDGYCTQAMNRRNAVSEALNLLVVRKRPGRVARDYSGPV